ncbi:unnamed protein product [Rotaria sordida]|uniref:Short-chain dehydrogenase/reductase 3 n=1 Tax=Rotaria sordida TaxID=392033 RepID=A0A818JSI3_9BILA|nr:unnamed protein product [Rotaria sordida]
MEYRAHVTEELNTTINTERIKARKCDLINRESIYEYAKKVLITEAASDVKKGVVQRLAHLGCTLILWDIDEVNNIYVVNELNNAMKCDLANRENIYKCARKLKKFSYILKAFLPSILDNNHGHVVTIASGADLTGVLDLVDYCLSKFCRHELHRLKKIGIKTTVICPNFINTSMFDGVATSEFLLLFDISISSIATQIESQVLKHYFIALVNLIRGGPTLKDLNSEIVLITGAASGLGKGIGQRLAHLGCTLVLWDIDEVNNIHVAEELNTVTNSERIHAMKCDLTNKENIYECAKKIQETVGHVTMIINNAGAVSGKQLVNCSDASIQRTFDVNVIAHFWILKAFLPSMLEHNYGHIVTIASAAGLAGVSGLVDYCSSKFAAVGLHEALTHELYGLKKYGIKTTVVCPGFINTGMFDGATSTDLTPLLDQEKVCDDIVKGIRQNKHLLIIPKSLTLSAILNRIAPRAAELEIHDMIGLHKSMDTFVGREKKST